MAICGQRLTEDYSQGACSRGVRAMGEVYLRWSHSRGLSWSHKKFWSWKSLQSCPTLRQEGSFYNFSLTYYWLRTIPGREHDLLEEWLLSADSNFQRVLASKLWVSSGYSWQAAVFTIYHIEYRPLESSRVKILVLFFFFVSPRYLWEEENEQCCGRSATIFEVRRKKGSVQSVHNPENSLLRNEINGIDSPGLWVFQFTLLLHFVLFEYIYLG